MPYITERRKEELDNGHMTTGDPFPVLVAGDLTYLLYVACLRPWDDDGHWYPAPPSILQCRFQDAIDRYMPSDPRYENFAIVLGSMDAAARELKRRSPQSTIWQRHAIQVFAEEYYHEVVAPYEDIKIEQNGDVLV